MSRRYSNESNVEQDIPSLQNDDEWKNALQRAGSKYVLVDFYADWCGPCRQMAPIVKRLAVRFPQVTFYKVNVDIYKKIAEKYKITGIPAFYLFSPAIHAIGLPAQTSDPKIIDSFMGAKNESDFKNWLTANLSKK